MLIISLGESIKYNLIRNRTHVESCNLSVSPPFFLLLKLPSVKQLCYPLVKCLFLISTACDPLLILDVFFSPWSLVTSHECTDLYLAEDLRELSAHLNISLPFSLSVSCCPPPSSLSAALSSLVLSPQIQATFSSPYDQLLLLSSG